MPAKKKTTQEPKEVYVNNALPILYVDAINTRHRDDGFTYVSLATHTPYRLVEQVRLMIDDLAIHVIIDGLCQITNYYPKEPSKKQRGPAK